MLGLFRSRERRRSRSEAIMLPLSGTEEVSSLPFGRSLSFVLVVLAALTSLLPLPRMLLLPLAIGLVLGAFRAPRLRRRKRGTCRSWVRVSHEGIARVELGREVYTLDFGSPFGLVIVANRSRTEALLVFTTRHALRVLRVARARSDSLDCARYLDVLSGATVVETLPDCSSQGTLSLDDADKLLRAVAQVSPPSIGVLYTSDTEGVPIMLRPGTLTVGDRNVDLGRGITLSHHVSDEGPFSLSGLLVKQGGEEVLFVSPLVEASQKRRAVPHGFERHAIDPLSFLAVRRALEQAPEARSRAPQGSPRRYCPKAS